MIESPFWQPTELQFCNFSDFPLLPLFASPRPSYPVILKWSKVLSFLADTYLRSVVSKILGKFYDDRFWLSRLYLIRGIHEYQYEYQLGARTVQQ